jgi:putative MATE family efflux protein
VSNLSDPLAAAGDRIPPRRIFSLAVPALGVLAAEPLYVLVDTAVVGHLGALPLAGLALGGVVLSQISSQLTFLSYGTTARTARLHGAGRRADAVREGVQATWLAVAIGLVLLVAGQLLAGPIARALSGGGPVAAAAVSWLRIALFGAPLILITMAGNGWMRGVQDAARPLRYVLAGNGISAVLCPVLVYGAGWGLEGSAVANVVAQVISAGMFLGALVREKAPLRPEIGLMRPPRSRRARPPPPSAPTRSCCSSGCSWRWCSTRWRSPRSRWSGRRSAPVPAVWRAESPGRSPGTDWCWGACCA